MEMTCAICLAAFRRRREIHTQHDRHVCCRCLSHAYGACPMTFTPGPWTIDHQRIGPPGEPVALLCDVNDSMTGTVIDWPRGNDSATAMSIDDAENEANARLIAAAPELLAIVQFIARDHRDGAQEVYFCALFGDDDITTLGDAVTAAIAKATDEVRA